MLRRSIIMHPAPGSRLSSQKSSLSLHALTTNWTGNFYTLVVPYIKFLCVLCLGLIKITFSCPTLVMMANNIAKCRIAVLSQHVKYGRRPRGLSLRPPVYWDLGVWITPAAWMSLSCECCVLSRRALCDGPIPRPEESYRECMSEGAIRRNSHLLHLQWVSRRVQNKK